MSRLDAIEARHQRDHSPGFLCRACRRFPPFWPCDALRLLAVARAAERLVAEGDASCYEGGRCGYVATDLDSEPQIRHESDCPWLALRDALAGAEGTGT